MHDDPYQPPRPAELSETPDTERPGGIDAYFYACVILLLLLPIGLLPNVGGPTVEDILFASIQIGLGIWIPYRSIRYGTTISRRLGFVVILPYLLIFLTIIYSQLIY